MERIRVLAIAPYEGLKELIISYAAQHHEFEIDAMVGDLADGLDLVRTTDLSAYDAIFSRGGTKEMIEGFVSIPVIDIIPSIYDMLRYIRLAQNYHGKFAVVGFRNITKIAEKLVMLMGIPLSVYTISSVENAEPTVFGLKEEGYSLIIGDAIATSIAAKYQMANILITSGTESIQEAFSLVRQICSASKAFRQQNQMLTHILHAFHEGIFVYHADQETLIYSNRAQDQAEYSEILQHLPDYFPALAQNDKVSDIRSFGQTDRLWRINGCRLQENGERYILFRISQMKAVPAAIRKSTSFYHTIRAGQVDNSCNRIGLMEDALKQAAAFAQSALPVCVLSARGTPAESIVQAIHEGSVYRNQPLVCIDLGDLQGKQLSWLLENEASPLYAVDTSICLKYPEQMNPDQQALLISYIQDTLLHKRNRVIYLMEAQSCGQSALFSALVAQECLLLHIPRLADDLENFSSIVSLYLSQLNIMLGKQAFAIQEGGMEMLRAYSWPGNQEQLRRVLKELLLLSSHGIISCKHITQVLHAESSVYHTAVYPAMTYSGTLEEITQGIVQHVLKEENGNKVKTAQRLGIGRSTLWRILNRETH